MLARAICAARGNSRRPSRRRGWPDRDRPVRSLSSQLTKDSHSLGWRSTSIVDLNCGGHAGRKDDIGGYLIDMDANRDALGQAYPGENGIDVSNPLTVGLRVRNVDCAGDA